MEIRNSTFSDEPSPLLDMVWGQAYALTGDETYAECFVNQLTDWIEKEPWRKDAADTTWRTLDAGLRADYWVRAMALCARSAAVTPQVVERFLEGLEIHANRLAENPRIGFSTKSNWGVMEYTGPVYGGLAIESSGGCGTG